MRSHGFRLLGALFFCTLELPSFSLALSLLPKVSVAVPHAARVSRAVTRSSAPPKGGTERARSRKSAASDRSATSRLPPAHISYIRIYCTYTYGVTLNFFSSFSPHKPGWEKFSRRHVGDASHRRLKLKFWAAAQKNIARLHSCSHPSTTQHRTHDNSVLVS